MNDKTKNLTVSAPILLRLPAFRWTTRSLWSEIRAKLDEKHKRSLTFAELGAIMGCPKTTAYRRFEELDHPTLVSLFACLEHLSPPVREQLLTSRCRVFADLEHPWISHSPARVGKLLELLNKDRGLTIISGGSELARDFVFNALGTSYHRLHANSRKIAALDLHRPDDVVPLEFCTYVEGAGLENVRKLVLPLWPRIVTTSARMVMLNGVWPIHDLRQDIFHLAARTHVVLATAGTPEVRRIVREVATPIHLITVSESKLVEQGIRLNLRRLKNAYSGKKTS